MTQITVSWDGGQAVYELNHSPAAQSLLAQLPLTTQVEDYSTNEKIFYPEEGLDTSDTPLAQAGAEPWPTMNPGAMWCSSMGTTAKTRGCSNWGRRFPAGI